jgi:hypothetical protein
MSSKFAVLDRSTSVSLSPFSPTLDARALQLRGRFGHVGAAHSGRGSRRPGQRVDRRGLLQVVGPEYCANLAQTARSSPLPAVRRRTHSYDPCSLLRWIPLSASLPKALRGLCYRQDQTFGIEFELAPKNGEIPSEDSPEWARIAGAIAEALKHHLPTGKFGAVHAEYVGSERNAKSPEHWNIEYDDTTGWEVTTRVLANLEGFCEVEAACRALQQVAVEQDLCVDVRTGTHIHLGWSGDIAQLQRAVRLVKLFEPALGSLVTPSRIAHQTNGHYNLDAPNPYCRPVASVIDDATLRDLRLFSDISRLTNGEDELRYVTFNLRPLDHQRTVEVRLHHGTLDAHKILRWVSLWHQILWAAENARTELEATTDVHVIQPSGDLIALARAYLAPIEEPGQRDFLELLRQDRSEIVERHWKRSPDLAAWVQASSAWT